MMQVHSKLLEPKEQLKDLMLVHSKLLVLKEQLKDLMLVHSKLLEPKVLLKDLMQMHSKQKLLPLVELLIKAHLTHLEIMIHHLLLQ